MKALLLVLILLSSMGALADSATESTHAQTKTTYNVPDEGYRLYGSLGGGGGALFGNSSGFSGSGEQYLAGFNFGRRTHQWEWDLGLSWGYMHRSTTTSTGVKESVRIRSARTDINPRYRLGGGWQLGPIAALNFGTDTQMDIVNRESLATLYGGLKATYDIFNLGAFPVQAWGELLTALTSDRHDDFTAMVGMRIGIPIDFEKKTDVIAVSSAAPTRDVRVVLDEQNVYFRTSSTAIKPVVAQTLRDVASLLSTNPDAWDSIELDGHADIRGAKKMNEVLSRKRALSVRDLLVNQGSLDNGKILIQAYGYSRPADPANNRLAWARNRRVEMTFKNVKDPDALIKRLAPLTSEPKETF